MNLTAVPAPNEAAAAEYYPPVYWLSMAKMPDKSEFPGTGHGGNGINENIKTQPRFLREFKTDGCFHCHALGTKATRTIPEAVRHIQVRLRGVDTANPVRPGQQGHGRDH